MLLECLLTPWPTKPLAQSLQKRWRCLPLEKKPITAPDQPSLPERELGGEGVVLSEEDAIGMSSNAMADKPLSQSLQKRWRCLPLEKKPITAPDQPSESWG